MILPRSKPCIKCGDEDIPKLKNICRVCLQEDGRLRYEREKIDGRRYLNRLRLNQEWMARNKKKFQAYQKKWAARNQDRIRQRKHEYYLANKEKILARNKIWKNKNRIPKSGDNRKHIWRELNRKIKKNESTLSA